MGYSWFWQPCRGLVFPYGENLSSRHNQGQHGTLYSLRRMKVSQPPIASELLNCPQMCSSRSVLCQTENVRYRRARNASQFEHDLRSRMACPQATTATKSREIEHIPLYWCEWSKYSSSQRPSSPARNGRVVLVCGGCGFRGRESAIQQRKQNQRREHSSARDLQLLETRR